MRKHAPAHLLLLASLLLSGCLLTDDFRAFSSSGIGGDLGVDLSPESDGHEGDDLGAVLPGCACRLGESTFEGCSPCALRVCDGCYFGACELKSGAACDPRGGANVEFCPAIACDRCRWPNAARRSCSSDCSWSECRCCGESGCTSCQ